MLVTDCDGHMVSKLGVLYVRSS